MFISAANRASAGVCGNQVGRLPSKSICFLVLIVVLVSTVACGGQASLSDAGKPGGTLGASSAAEQGNKPVAMPGAFPLQGGVPLNVHLFDAGSYDPNGEIVMWEWNFGDAAPGEPAWQDYTASEGDCWHLFTKPGMKVAHLRVTDNDGNKDVAFVKIEMSQEGNANPVAVANADPTVGSSPLLVLFDPNGSYDPDGIIVKWEWDLDNGAGFQDYTASDGHTSFEYYSWGLFAPTLRVTDDDGAVSTCGTLVDINAVPVACISAQPVCGPAPLAVCFDATGSYDPDGDVVYYEFDFDEGADWESHGTSAIAEHIYSDPGTYSPRVRVTDVDGACAIARCVVSVMPVNNPWPMFHRDAARTGYSPWLGPNHPAVKWVADVGGQFFSSSPAVSADGTVYAGSSYKGMCAISADGQVKWCIPVSTYIYASPALAADGTVYFATWAGYLYALNPDGSAKWRFTTHSPLSASPLVASDGTVYIADEGDWMYAIDPAGDLIWEFQMPGATGVDQSSPALMPGGGIVVGADNLIAVSASGHLLWKTANYPVVESTPAVAEDGTVYVGTWYENKIRALHPDGSEYWAFQAGSNVRSSPAIAGDGTIHALADDGLLYAVAPDGQERWRCRVNPSGLDTSYPSPIVDAAGGVYVGANSGEFYKISSDGDIVWSMNLASRITSCPAMDCCGLLYVTTSDGTVFAIEESNR